MTSRHTLSAIAVSAAVSSAMTAGLLTVLPATAAVESPSRPSLASIYSREAKTAADVERIASDVKTLKLRAEESRRVLQRLDERVGGGTRVSFGRSPYELLVGLYSGCVNNQDCTAGP